MDWSKLGQIQNVQFQKSQWYHFVQTMTRSAFCQTYIQSNPCRWSLSLSSYLPLKVSILRSKNVYFNSNLTCIEWLPAFKGDFYYVPWLIPTGKFCRVCARMLGRMHVRVHACMHVCAHAHMCMHAFVPVCVCTRVCVIQWGVTVCSNGLQS